MIKAGLIGWLCFLPLGEVAMPDWGTFFLIAGLAAAFYGVMIGLTQDNPKTVLAYSSISQMGFMTIGIGIGFKAPDMWPVALTAIVVYALHHALAKGALFLSVGLSKGLNTGGWQRVLVLSGILLPALALAGAPFTSGAVAKLMLKEAVIFIPEPWPVWLSWLLFVAAFATTSLMGRFLYLIWPTGDRKAIRFAPGLWLSWYVLLICVIAVAWLFAPDQVIDKAIGSSSLSGLGPVIAGTLAVWVLWQGRLRLFHRIALNIPAGDILVGAGWLRETLRRWYRKIITANGLSRLARNSALLGTGFQEQFTRIKTHVLVEIWIGQWITAGMGFALLIAIIFALLMFSAI
jgi:NADH:ubiquinone oxidoreductase subunit 5 (subunit L)/multisubunit Na+/H+ antiporter MnhA subunit